MTKEEINSRIKQLEAQQYEADIAGRDEQSYELGCRICALFQEIPED